tara:strand:+ start:1145 stop:2653 length:1509 start_codon:yes stop_codon:yes gene_type:complete
MSAVIEVKYFNSFILRKTVDANNNPVWNGSNGDNTMPVSATNSGAFVNTVTPGSYPRNWYIEESRIRGGYNNTSVGYGARAYLVEEEPNSSVRINAMIYSGIFNSTTGVNNTNVFSVGDDITKAVDPSNGSIQKLYAQDNNLIVFQENKVSQSLIDKDAIFSAEGGAITTSGKIVIGQNQSYAGNFGISRNPESFAVYGTRIYFTDKDRNAVLRLANNGLTEISNYGMVDFFRDEFSTLDNASFGKGRAYGTFDIYTKQYVVSLQQNSANPNATFKTLSFDEAVTGWTSFYSYKPYFSTSLKNFYYTFNSGRMYVHNSAAVPRAQFYGVNYKASVKFIFNPSVSLQKNFQTINYEGDNGWQVDSILSDFTGVGGPNLAGLAGDLTQAVTRDGGNATITNPVLTSTPAVWSYNQGSYDNYGNQYPTRLIPPINNAGFVRMENKYKAFIPNNSTVAPGEILFGSSMTGIKGYFATVTMSTDNVTDVGGMKELFAVSSEYVESSY